MNKLIIILLAGLISTNCLKKIGISFATDFMKQSRVVFESENDLELAEIALGANLKLIEAMWVHSQENDDLNLFLAEGYTMYAMAFMEDKMEEFEFSNEEKFNYHRKRAINIYKRGRRYAGLVLNDKLDVKSVADISHDDLRKKLADLDEDDKGAVFWYAFSWGLAINIDREDMEGFAQIGKIEIMMEQVKVWDEKYFFGGPYIFEGIYYGARSKTMGGKHKRSKAAFTKAMSFTNGKFLIVPYFYAKTYCVFTQNKKCFHKYIKQVLDTPENAFPKQILANVLAKKKARRLLKQEADLFVD